MQTDTSDLKGDVSVIERRACWVVLVRVNERADWCAYGPVTHREALDYRHTIAGSGMEWQLAQLIPMKGGRAKPLPIVDVKSGSA